MLDITNCKELVEDLRRSAERYNELYALYLDCNSVESSGAQVIRKSADVIEQLFKERDRAVALVPHVCRTCGNGYYSETGFECDVAHYKGGHPDCLSWCLSEKV